MNVKYKTLHIELDIDLKEVDTQILEYLLSKDKLTTNQFVERKIRAYVAEAQTEENRVNLPIDIKVLLQKEAFAKDKDKKMRQLGKFLVNTSYNIRKGKVRFSRSGPDMARVQFPYDKVIVEDIKREIAGTRWDRVTCSWQMPIGSLDKMREILYQRLGVRGDLDEFDDAWLAKEFKLTVDDVKEVKIAIQDAP